MDLKENAKTQNWFDYRKKLERASGTKEEDNAPNDYERKKCFENTPESPFVC